MFLVQPPYIKKKKKEHNFRHNSPYYLLQLKLRRKSGDLYKTKLQNSLSKLYIFFFFSFQSSKFHLFLIESSVNVLLVIAIHLLKWRRFGYYYYHFLISRKLKIVNSGERCRSLAHLITKIIPTPTDIYLHLSLLHSSSNLKQLIRQSWFSMVNMHNDAEIPYTRHWNLQLPNQNKKSSSKANTQILLKQKF